MRLFLLVLACLHLSIMSGQQFGDVYGLNFSSSQLRLATADPVTGDVTVVSPNVLSADQFGSGNSDLDSDSMRYFYIRAGQVITVDLQSGLALHAPAISCSTHQFNSLQPISNIAYDHVTGSIYGLLHFQSQLWFAKVNPVSGVMTVLSNGPISPDLYQSGVSDIDPYNGRYFYIRAGRIVTVDIATASIVSQPIIQNPNNAVSPITNIAYNWLTDEVCGINYIGAVSNGLGSIISPAELRFCTVDINDGSLSILSSTVISADLFSSGVADIDPVDNVYYYVRAGALYAVDVGTGDLYGAAPLNDTLNSIAALTNIAVVKDRSTTPPPLATFDPTVVQNEIFVKNESLWADSHTWDFGDGHTSTAKHPVHQYNLPGTYTVELEATNRVGQTHVHSMQVVISAASVNDVIQVSNFTNIQWVEGSLRFDLARSAELSLYSVSGKLLMRSAFSAGSHVIQSSRFSGDAIVYQLLLSDGQMFSGKLVETK